MINVLVIGSSYIGAVFAGWRNLQLENPNILIDFLGSPAQYIRDSIVKNGKLSQIKVKTSERKIQEYDVFVVIADLPSPRDIFRFFLQSKNYTSVVKKLAVSDLFDSSLDSYIINNHIRPFSNAPVTIASRPEDRSELFTLNDSEYTSSIDFLRKSIKGDGITYMPPPRSTLNDSYVPIAKFYSGAVDITGIEAQEQNIASLGHFNEKGGVEVLNDFFKKLLKSALMQSNKVKKGKKGGSVAKS